MQKRYSKRTPGRSIRKAKQTDPLIWTVAIYMNSSAQPQRPAGACRLGIRLLLGILSCEALAASSRAPEIPREIGSRPYLTVTGAAPLRFPETAPPPDLSVRLPAGGPPHLTPVISEAPVNAVKPEDLPNPGATAAAATASTEQPPAPATKEKPATAGRPILPDDSKPKVRAEDFLPYFQFPGANTDRDDVPTTPKPPAPGILPPSSASYRQQ